MMVVVGQATLDLREGMAEIRKELVQIAALLSRSSGPPLPTAAPPRRPSPTTSPSPLSGKMPR